MDYNICNPTLRLRFGFQRNVPCWMRADRRADDVACIADRGWTVIGFSTASDDGLNGCDLEKSGPLPEVYVLDPIASKREVE